MAAAGTAPFPRRALRPALLVTALVSLIGVWLVNGSVSSVPQVYVDWKEGVSDLERERAQVQLSLRLIRIDDPDTWVYILVDTSTSNILAIVSHAAIERTRYLDRDTLRPTGLLPLSPVDWIDFRYPSLTAAFGSLHRIVRVRGAIPVFGVALLMALAAMRDGRRWLVARVPSISPLTLGVFRVALALALWVVVRASVIEPYRVPCFAFLALFLAGMAPRLAFAGFVIAFSMSAEQLDKLTDHDFALPIKTLWLMMLVPWGAGLSVDELVRRRRGHEPNARPSRRYGLAVWIPVLMLGLAYAAAAFAKFDEHGFGWIARGAVRYFFVIDAKDAPSGLGRAIASDDVLAVVFSAGAVVSEMSVVLAAIWPGTLLALLGGCAALALHTGFYLFQGVWWPAWWALLPAFLPWQWMVTAARKPQKQTNHLPAPPPPVQRRPPAPRTTAWASVTAAIVFLAVLQQPVASLLREEYWFLMSDFPMYSHLNYESKEAFAAQQDREHRPPPSIRFDVRDGDSKRFESRLLLVDPTTSIVGAARILARGAEPSSSEVAAVHEAAARYQQIFGARPAQVEVMANTWHFDWAAADFVLRPEWTRVATLDLSSGVLVR